MFRNEDLVKKSYYLVVFCKKHGQTQNYFWQKHNSVCVKKINLSSWTSKDKRHPIWEMYKIFYYKYSCTPYISFIEDWQILHIILRKYKLCIFHAIKLHILMLRRCCCCYWQNNDFLVKSCQMLHMRSRLFH